MEIRKLESFVAVVKYKNFTKAAEELYISQPTISAHIKELETELNTQLVIRSTKLIQITKKGYELYECALKILNLQDDLLGRWSGVKEKEIRIGSSTIPSMYILPSVLPKFCKKHDHITVTVHQTDSTNVIQGVKFGDFDVILSGLNCTDDHIVSQPFFVDEMVMITPNQKKFTQMYESGNMKGFFEESIILREEGSASQKKADRIYEALDIQPNKLHVVARVNNPETIKNYVSNGFGISIISKIAVEDYVAQKKLLAFPLPEEVAKRNLYILYPRHCITDDYVRQFVSFVCNEYKHKLKFF